MPTRRRHNNTQILALIALLLSFLLVVTMSNGYCVGGDLAGDNAMTGYGTPNIEIFLSPSVALADNTMIPPAPGNFRLPSHCLKARENTVASLISKFPHRGNDFEGYSVKFMTRKAKEKRHEEIRSAIWKVSIPFIKSCGQVSEEVAFYAKTLARTIFVTKKGEIVYSPPEGSKESSKAVALRERFVFVKGIDTKGERIAETRVNYFIGNDPSRWKADIPTYEAVSLGEVWNGVELSLKAYGNNVEKLFKVKPFSDPSLIKVEVSGGGLALDKEGRLVVNTGLGEVAFTKPVAYQLDGRGDKREVQVAYHIDGDTYGFKLGEYDETRDLIIDPLLASTFIGGSHDETAWALALDSFGNVYVAGTTWSSDYPTTPGAYDESYSGEDVFVSKLNSSPSSLLASTFIGGKDSERAFALALDSSGNVYVAGWTWSSDYPTTPGAYDESYNGFYYDDVFVSRLTTEDTVVEEEGFPLRLPLSYRLYQNYPNPFNSETVIHYQLPKKSWVTIKVFNLRGQEIRALVNEEKQPGYFTTHWDGKDSLGRDVASGVYLYQVKARDFATVRKMLLLRHSVGVP